MSVVNAIYSWWNIGLGPGAHQWSTEGGNLPTVVPISTATHLWISHTDFDNGDQQAALENLDVGDLVLVYQAPWVDLNFLVFLCQIDGVTHGADYVQFDITWLDGDASIANGNSYGFPQRLRGFHADERICDLYSEATLAAIAHVDSVGVTDGLNCEATLTASGSIAQQAAAALVCVASVTADVQKINGGNSSLECVSSLTANAYASDDAAAALECEATLSASGDKLKGAATALPCLADLTATASTIYAPAAALQCVASITANADGIQNTSAALVCVASLTATPYVSIDYAADLHSICTIAANGETSSKSHLHGVCTITAAGRRVKNASAHRSSVCNLSVAGSFVIEGSSGLAAVCSLSADATATHINYIEEALFALLSPLGSVSFASVEQELLERLE